MAVCRVAKVRLAQDGPRPIDEDLAFEVELDVAEPLAEDAVFRCVYITDASNPKADRELESIDVGNGPGLPAGIMTFTLEAPAPSKAMITESGGPLDIAGMYLSAVYKGSEFCRVGYYVRHEYNCPALRETPPDDVDWTRLQRVISEPVATSFTNTWDGLPPAPAPSGASAATEPSADLLKAPSFVEDSANTSSQYPDSGTTATARDRSRSPGRSNSNASLATVST